VANALETIRAMSGKFTMILNLHVAGRPKHGRTLCRECGMPYPCDTRQICTGFRTKLRTRESQYGGVI
jgi:hypothetical protein